MRHAGAVLIFVLLGFCGTTAGASASATPEAKMLAKINKVRTHERGLRPLRMSPNLEHSAGAFAGQTILRSLARPAACAIAACSCPLSR